jgi:peptide/nickel transport system permease protein
LPWLFLLFALRAFLPLQLEPVTAFVATVFVIGIVGWARPARFIRNSVLTVKERECVLAARGLSVTDCYLLRRHILPAVCGVVLTQATARSRYVLAEITLSFFGLGVNEPQARCAQMLASKTQQYMVAPHSAWMYAPILSLVLTCYSYLTLAEYVRVRFG